VVLFTRHARRIELTDHGRAYTPSVRQAFDELAVSTAGLFGFVRPSRRLTARVPVSYAVAFVAPRLHDFKATHPDIELRLVSHCGPIRSPVRTWISTCGSAEATGQGTRHTCCTAR